MSDEGQTVTVKLPDDLVSRLGEVAGQTGRSENWIVREALSQWLAEYRRRHELTLEALKSTDEGRTIPHEEVVAMMEERRRERREAEARSAP
jgi:predicted transcriptional regulator